MNQRIEEIEKRLKAATPPPWSIRSVEQICRIYGIPELGKKNAEFIAHSPADVAYLLERLKKAVEVIEYYANGGNPNMDIWKHENLGYFTGLRAREFLKELGSNG